MAGRNVPVVLIQRFTTYAGPTTFWSQPIPVSAYASIQFDYAHATMNGTPAGGVQIDLQESNDAEVWASCAGGSPWTLGPGAVQAPLTGSLSQAWVRIGVTPQGTQPAVTCWAQGFFEQREKGL